MVTFIIVRHGYSLGNKEKRFSGQMDVPLDEIGTSQAQSITKYIAENYNVDSIYSSDLLRAYETVKPLADKLCLEVNKDEKIREVDVGKWQGMLIEAVKNQFPEQFEAYRTKPGLTKFDDGESFEDVMRRGMSAFEKIAQENEGKTVVVGTHGGVIRVMRAAWDKVPLEKLSDIPHVPNASISVATYDKGNIKWLQIGYDGHLNDKITEQGIV